MKTEYKTKKLFSTFLAAISCFILLLSISSCEFFTFSDLKENENAANASEQLSSSNTCNLHITPRFGNETLHTQGSSRSAFPDFSPSSFSFSGYTFKATSTVLLGEVTGAYNSGTGNISFSFSDATFSEPTEFTFYICNSSGKELFYGTKLITYTTLGSEISKTVYFKSYDSSEVNGHIDLKVSVTSDYTLSCEIKNSSDESVCGNTGDPISVDSSGNITTGTDGIAPGTYKAYISVKKGSQLYDYIIQEINVWPDLTTNRWYLPDGTTSQTYNIEISEDQVKFWVKGTGAGGPYAGDVIVPASYTADGSITKPYTSLNDAFAVCTSNSTDYIIKVCGTVSGNSIIDSTVNAPSISIEGVSGSDVDILDGSATGSVLKINKALDVTLKNIQLTNGGGGTTYYGGGLYISSGANVVLENDVLITENTAVQKGGGVYIFGPNSKLTMMPGSKITKNYISASNNGYNEYGGAGVYIGANTYSDTDSPELILNGGEISEHSLAHEMRGAGVFVNKAKLIVNSGKITKNKATDIAANVMLQNDSKMTMTGGEISYGEINGTADASAAGVWINGTTSMTMSGGKICNNTVKADSGNVGRGAGITVWQTGGNFIMTGGEISDNKVDTTYSDIIQGGAVCVYDSAVCNFSGDIEIPYGVNGTEGKGLNDIWIFNNNKITIKGKLSTPASGKIGAISPQSYTEGKVLLEVADDASPATTIEDEAGKFTLVQPATGSEKWLLLKSGKLRKEVQDAYVAATAVSETTLTSQLTMNGVSGTESSLFIAGRTISIPKMIVSDHELTQKEYLEYCFYATKIPGETTFDPNNGQPIQTSPQGDNVPAIFISWYDVIVYCNLRSIDEGLTPAYSLDGKTNPVEWDDITRGTGTNLGKYCGPASSNPNWNGISFNTIANGWRMPTELEWEYLARGGTLNDTGLLVIDSTNYDTYAWTSNNTPTKVCHEVKLLDPNTLGLYDIYGNVYELVWDWSGTIGTSTPLTGNSTGEKRVVRGGGMGYTYNYCNSYNRQTDNYPYSRWENCGVRIVRNAD